MELHAGLGANQPVGTASVTLFVPSVDRLGTPIDQKRWEEEALNVFGKLFRGATAFPPGRGVWRDDQREGALVFDETVLVTSYVDPALLDTAAVIAELRRFLHQMGRTANQGEVGIVINDEYFGITVFDTDDVDQGGI